MLVPGKQPALAALQDCTFTRCTLSYSDGNCEDTFVDPTRNLTTFCRAQAGIKAGAAEVDVARAIDFIRTHPERMPEMVDWIRAGWRCVWRGKSRRRPASGV